ncbi:hypothetical protein GE061_004097 [Apolygus lucorum]|uniref:Uncharacterized protein n=1 Tax=Apolygus lucorum TaxID=248454 RepID=A0A8S9WY91_APOLU|nr:hypothetical protein GE061_004097 [Apolygus lucorum]
MLLPVLLMLLVVGAKGSITHHKPNGAWSTHLVRKVWESNPSFGSTQEIKPHISIISNVHRELPAEQSNPVTLKPKSGLRHVNNNNDKLLIY